MSVKVPIVAIVGRANVGKSSLFNAILGRREAIVADEPGTTRDSINARANWDGKDFWLVDTAGLKTAEDDFELTIQEQIGEAAASADSIVVVVEADVPITEEDRRVATLALRTKKPVILAVNKIDKNQRAKLDEWQRLGIKPAVGTSSTQKTGIDDLLDEVAANLPKARLKSDNDTIRVALLGRPNVGKSSLFNALAKKQQAIVSDKAGTTRDVNRTTVRYQQRPVELADTAGIRRSGKIERGVEKFSVLRALAAIEQSDIALVLMDGNELNVQLDQKIAGLVKEAGKGLILVVSKWDSVVDKDAYTRDAVAPQIAANFVFVPWAPLIFTSAITGQNVTKIYDLILEIDAARHQKFKTTELNQWLRRAVGEHPPAGLKNRSPKLNYMVQEDNDYPNFKVFGAHTKFLHWSYKRYLERKFRDVWPLTGTPLKFWFIEKH
jgi:GTP-binding protein